MRRNFQLYGAAEFMEKTARCLAIMAGVVVLVLVAYCAVLWVVLAPFRMAYRLHNPRQGNAIRIAELEGLVALAFSGLALLRSGQAPLTKREWKRRHRKLMAQRPDDKIPF